MTDADGLLQLIVCSDDRAGELAKVLRVAGPVYGRQWYAKRSAWIFSRFEDDQWKYAVDESVPLHFALLFFHTGAGDPEGIPADRDFLKEFAFSTGGVAEAEAAGWRPNAIAIQRHFPTGGCPVKARHINELKSFVEGTRKELPAFCQHNETVPALSAIAILCQGFAAAGIACGDILPNGAFATALGWNRLKAAQISRLSNRLAGQWQQMRTAKWWRASLGICADAGESSSEERLKLFLAGLIQDLELDVLALHWHQGKTGEDSIELTDVDLLGFLGEQSAVLKIKDLLNVVVPRQEAPDTQPITTKIVEDAYCQVKNFLEQK